MKESNVNNMIANDGKGSLLQIKDFMQHKVWVRLADNTISEGTLSFYNYENRTIHLSDYESKTDDTPRRGTFLVINGKEWRFMGAK